MADERDTLRQEREEKEKEHKRDTSGMREPENGMMS